MFKLFYLLAIINNQYDDNANETIYTISLFISRRYRVHVVINQVLGSHSQLVTFMVVQLITVIGKFYYIYG